MHKWFGLVILLAVTPLVMAKPEKKNADKYNLLVITSQAYLQQVNIYVQFKNSQGCKTRTTIVEEIEQKEKGRDLPEKIRSYISQEWLKKGIEYVLLAGDVTQVPTRYIFNPDLKYDQNNKETNEPTVPFDDLDRAYCPTDYYYANLTDDWDTNHNNIFGESKIFSGVGMDEGGLDPQICVGRIPARSPKDMLLMLTKLMTFTPLKDRDLLAIGTREDQELPVDGYWYGDMLKVRSQDDRAKVTLFTEYYDDLTVPQVLAHLNKDRFAVMALTTPGMPCGALFNIEPVRKKLLEFGYYSFAHPDVESFLRKKANALTSSKILFNSDVTELLNSQPFLALCFGGWMGKFDYPSYSLAEALMMQRGGAIASMGLARSVFGSKEMRELANTVTGGGIYEMGFGIVKRLFKENLDLGHAVWLAKAEYVSLHPELLGQEASRRALLGFNLFGDPTMKLFAD